MTTPTLTYPVPPRADVVDDYHGTRVADPYRPLEDLDTPATAAWIAAENALTERYLAAVPERDAIRARLEALWDYERWGVPSREGPWLVTQRNSGLQNQAVVYVQRELDETPRVLLDPNLLSADGTVALSGLSFSDDGRFAAYATSASGSDWLEWRVREVETGADLPDLVAWSKFSDAVWRHDGAGFYYARYAAPAADADTFRAVNLGHELYYHALGTPQDDDVLVFTQPDHPDWHVAASVSDDGAYLVVSCLRGTDPRAGIFVRPAGIDGAGGWTTLFDVGVAQWTPLGNDGRRFYFQTTDAAPRGRIVAVDVASRVVEELVPQHPADVLEAVTLLGRTFFVRYLHDAHSVVRRYDVDGHGLGEVTLPGLGTVGGFDGKRSSVETFFAYTSFTQPTSIYRYDLADGAVARIFAPRVAFPSERYVTEQVFYSSKDGTRVPMFLTARRDAVRDGRTPTILYGYGGFDIPLTPAFSPAIATWLELGGVWACANLRGGGEYGEAWHEAGQFEKKQNVFDDFIAAAEWLVANGWTSPSRLAIHGGSNGGLLVGACMLQRPDLFGAVLPSVGVFDMLRFQTFTIGWAWTSEYGTAEDAAQFPALYAYSPLHNVRAGVAYPPTLITTGDHDDRVYPAHSFKFAAALQAAQGGDAPILIRVETRAGHGAGKPTAKVIAETADRYAFLVRALAFSPTA